MKYLILYYKNIASKIIEGKELSDREMAIFTERTSDIEAFIQKIRFNT